MGKHLHRASPHAQRRSDPRPPYSPRNRAVSRTITPTRDARGGEGYATCHGRRHHHRLHRRPYDGRERPPPKRSSPRQHHLAPSAAPAPASSHRPQSESDAPPRPARHLHLHQEPPRPQRLAQQSRPDILRRSDPPPFQPPKPAPPSPCPSIPRQRPPRPLHHQLPDAHGARLLGD